MMRCVTYALSLVLLWPATASAGDVDGDLQARLDQADPNAIISVLLYLADGVDPAVLTQQLDTQKATLRMRHEVVVTKLQETAQRSQTALLNHLQTLQHDGLIEHYEPYWVANIIRVDAAPQEIFALAERGDVEQIYFNYPIELIKPVSSAPDNAERAAAGLGNPESGVAAVRAPEVWAQGITGEGSLVATLDTGVDGSHPALASRWRGLDPAYDGHPGWAFFDPVTGWTFPQDSGDHGTHTMGSVCGGPPGDAVGVAPGAEWIHAAVIDRVSIGQTISDAILAFQWLIDPDGNPATNFDVPDVCSNSWGLADIHGTPDCDETFWIYIDNCEAAGIVMLFSAGNEGFGGIRRPADRATDDYRNLAVAAVDANNPSFPIAGFSSRGPTFCTPGGSAAIKPDIAAPGVSVRSAVPGGGYGNKDGTSMASPHINGVVALMRQANPDLAVEQIKQIMYETAQDLGPAGKDNDYGWGMVDAFEAVQHALSTVNLSFTFPFGRPNFLDPAGGTVIAVTVTGQATVPEPGTGMLHYSTGGEFTSIPMTEYSPNHYQAIFPTFSCGAPVTYYFSAETNEGEMVVNPFSAPDTTYSAMAYSGMALYYEDDFEADLGWTVEDSDGLTSGSWERGEPAGGGDRGDPATDGDGSGQCYVTGLADGDNDIDGGSTVLTSPVMDGSDPNAVLSYYRWFSNSSGADPFSDVFIVEVSDDGGANWTILETVGPDGPEVGGGWIHQQFLVADIPDITDPTQLQVRFTAADLDAGSVIEAGVDGVKINSLFCDIECPTDLNRDGTVDAADLSLLLGGWDTLTGDLNGDGTTDAADLALLIGSWGPCS